MSSSVQSHNREPYRRFKDGLATGVAYAASVFVLVPLAAIFGYLVYRGFNTLDLDFFIHLPKPVGEVGGGMANSIVGSAYILGMGSLIGLPLGIGAGIYTAEYGRGRFATVVRFIADVLSGVPSIVMGVTIYGLIVMRQKHFSALAGAVALGIMMIPITARATEEVLLMVPKSLREASLALGVPKWRTTLSIALRSAAPGVITGCMLAFARVAGETAPLLFTAFGNAFWNLDPNQPTAALPLQIFTYAISPYDDWHRQAWAGSLVLVVLIVIAVGAVRWFSARNTLKGTM